MNKRKGICQPGLLYFLMFFFIFSSALQARKEKKEGKAKSEKPVRGELLEISDTFLVFKIQNEEKVKVTLAENPSFSFVGFSGYMDNVTKPQKGFFVSVSRINDGDTINAAQFSPPFPALQSIENKHLLSADELFKIADENKDGKVTYMEYSTHIYQSLKHGPGKFRKKMDKDSDGVINLQEFRNSLNEFTWYRLSRKAAEEWFKEKDIDNNQSLDIKEAAGLFRIHGDLEPVFKKYDKDKSGGISVEEYKIHWTEVVTGPQRQ